MPDISDFELAGALLKLEVIATDLGLKLEETAA
jgi:hypothetical protein